MGKPQDSTNASSPSDVVLSSSSLDGLHHRSLRKQMRESGLIEHYTVRELLREMDTLTKINYSDQYGHIMTELTKPQRQIHKALDIPILDPASL